MHWGRGQPGDVRRLYRLTVRKPGASMMENSKKVVQINGQRDEASESNLYARLPAPFAAMKERGNLALQPLLQRLFDNIDDALFELADKAEHNSEQNMYFESMREVRIKRRGMELGFSREISETFRQLVKITSNPPLLSDKEEVTSVDQLALVEHDELEELVAVDSMVGKAEKAFTTPLYLLTTRLNSLVDGVTVTDSNNPLGPAAVCRAFIEVCSDLEIDIKAKLVLFKLFDRYVMKALDKVYVACNSVLVDGGILPNLGGRDANAQRAVGQTTVQQTSAGNDDQVFNDLQQLLHLVPQHNSPVSNGLVAPGLAPALPQNTIMQLLQRIQLSQLSVMEQQQCLALQGTVPAQIDIKQALNNLLVTEMPSQAMSMGEVDHDAINLVAMLFQFILDDRNLAAPMKALIARLQIPLIKVAMLDKSFFSKGGHPARKLLNEIAHASIGWMQTENIERDPLYVKVESVVSRLLNEFEGDASLFDEILTDFIAFLEIDRRRSGLVAQRTVNAEDGKAKTEMARTRVQDVLNEKVAGKSLPKVVITLLEEAWSNVLFLIYLKEGEEKNWNNALKVVDELLWSVEPMKDTSSRQRLLKVVPSLLKNLRAGLTKIAYNPFDMNQLFADLEKIHLAQLQELNTVKPKLVAVATEPTSTSIPTQTPESSAVTSAPETNVSGKTLDQVLDARTQRDSSLKKLDEELAEFDALGDRVAETTAPSNSDEMTNNGLERQVVEKIVVNGAASETEQPTDVPLTEDDPDIQRVDAMEMGDWVELHQDDGKKFRCRLAAVIRSTGKHIFVNRSGMKVAEYTRQSLALALKSGVVTPMDDGLLFDRALESVIGNLRDMNSSSH
jgi:Protein of unknown function (DUF1631)